MLKVFSETFEVMPQVGARSDSLIGDGVRNIFGPLKITLLLMDDGVKRLCFVCAPFYCDFYPISNLLRDRLGNALQMPREQIAIFSSHNHSCVMLSESWPFPDGFPQEKSTLREEQLTAAGLDALNGLLAAASRANDNLTEVRVAWGLGRERRISHNRKGRRADGSTYFMREEDRLLQGADFNGDIDDDAPVVAFLNDADVPVAFLTQFTAHPVTAYHPEDPVVFGDYPQIACDDLSAAYDGAPAAFLQGCAGDVNAKGLLDAASPEAKVARATRYGHCLGETYIAASRDLTISQRTNLDYAWERVKLPFTPVPPASRLRAELKEIEDFLQRCAAGDENTRSCVGLNFPSTLSPRYRACLVEPSKRWNKWALQLHEENRLHEAPCFVEVVIGIFRIGDVAIVGMPLEPFQGIGRQIRAKSTFPLTIPCGYMNDNIAYVPDAPNLGDRDYSSSYYRYTNGFLPFERPGGNLLAEVAARRLNQMARSNR